MKIRKNRKDTNYWNDKINIETFMAVLVPNITSNTLKKFINLGGKLNLKTLLTDSYLKIL